MANTIMSAKNSFLEGLIMDFAPDNTQATCLTSALNATLLTFNGNEMSLLNDMGNGRVETAFLPEGYVPVGTCEFGDIIYIVSYNPLINKSLIGCFPSPERNISSEEIGDLAQNLNWKDFQEGDEGPNGKLKASSVKKILYDSKSLNPGDKYIIYSSEVGNNFKTLSDYSNLSQTHNTFPKLVKVHVVAIEDSGKINYLDSSVKWYDNDYYISNKRIKTANGDGDIDEYRNLVSSNYSIFQSKVSGKLAILVELERISTFNHSYSIKTEDEGDNRNYTVNLNVSWETLNKNINPSGVVITDTNWRYAKDNNTIGYNDKEGNKEITMPNYNQDDNNYYGFYLGRIYKPENDISYDTFIDKQLYDVVIKDYINDTNIILDKVTTEESGNTYYINPKYIDGAYKKINSDGTVEDLQSISISDDIVNNYFHKEVTKELITITIPYKTVVNNKTYYNDISNFVWDYKIAPVMPYGILEDLEMSGSIDFSKIGSGMIDLSEWRYYNDGNISTLKWGLEAYPENNKKITKVAFEFYDNQGVVGTYIIKDKASFSGSFTEVLQLGAEGINPKLTPNDIDGKLIINHAGDGPYTFLGDINEFTITELGYVSKIVENENGTSEEFYYKNDAGVLYPNLVYLVKIYVYTAEIDSLGNIVGEQTRSNPFIRFYWTNGLLNNYYYNTIDYVGILPELSYLLDVSFKSNDNFYAPRPESDPGKYIINNQSTKPNEDNPSVEDIAKATLGGMIQRVETTGTGNNRENLYMSIVPCLDNSYNTFTFDYNKLSEVNYNIYLADQKIKYSDSELIFSDSYVGNLEVMERKETKTPSEDPSLEDYFAITSILNELDKYIKYQSVEGHDLDGTYPYFTISAQKAMSFGDSLGVPLVLEGLIVSKIAGTVYSTKEISAIVYKPAIGLGDDGSINTEELTAYGIGKNDVSTYFTTCFITGMSGNSEYKCNFGLADCTSGSYGDFYIPDENSRIKYDGSAIQNMDLGVMLKNSNLETSPYSLLSFFMFDGKIDEALNPDSSKDLDGHILLKTAGGKNQNINLTWRLTWRLSYLNDRSYVLRFPFKEKENYSDGGNVVWNDAESLHPFRTLNAFVAKTVGGNYILFNNFFTSYPAAGTNVSQKFAHQNYCGGIQTMALMLISLFSKIYYRSGDTEEIPINTVSNIVTWDDYTATWEKNIVTEVLYNNNGKTLLVMQGLSYEDYINDLKINSKLDISDDKNIELILNMSKVHTTKFLYDLKYNIEYLLKLYNSSEIMYYINPDITGDIIGHPVNLPPFLGTLGAWDFYSKSFVPLSSIYRVPALNSSFKNNTDTNNAIKLSTKILNNLTLKDNIVMLRDIGTNSKARIEMISGNYGDSKGACWFKLDSNNCFFDDSIFKIY